MKNITFSADEELIEQARAAARARGTTLNEEVRKWLRHYSSPNRDGSGNQSESPMSSKNHGAESQLSGAARVERFRALMDRLKHVDLGGPYARDELNER